MDIQKCILKIYSDWRGTVWNNSYEGIKPHELETRPVPTLKQLEAVWPEVQKEIALEECYRKRQAEYPPMVDYIDGVVKGNSAQVQAYIDACLAVKAKYPKPV